MMDESEEYAQQTRPDTAPLPNKEAALAALRKKTDPMPIKVILDCSIECVCTNILDNSQT
jgi:hypothetical protein